MSRGPTYNFQAGGAIYIEDGTLVVHDSTSDTNTAGDASESMLVVSRAFLNFPDFSLYVRGRHMQLLNGSLLCHFYWNADRLRSMM
jgi:hypothetical protein